MPKIIVIYDPLNGYTVPDGQVANVYNSYIQNIKIVDDQPIMLTVGHSLPIDYFRLAIKNGQINCEDIVFRFMATGEDIPVNKDGRLKTWPEGFCDYTENILCQL